MEIFQWITFVIIELILAFEFFIIVKEAIQQYWDTGDVLTLSGIIALLIGMGSAIITTFPFIVAVK